MEPLLSTIVRIFRRPVPGIVLAALFCVVPARADEELVNSLGMRFRAVDDGVWLCMHPTRVQDFAAYTAATGVGVPEPGFPQEADHPVVNISWEDARRFCAWLTEAERAAGKIGERLFYRLPSEAEWERAGGLEAGAAPRAFTYASGPLVFPWGDSWPPPEGAGNFSQELEVDPFSYTSPVMSFSPNENGFYDLSGNVWEWCEDTFEGAPDMRVLKGGSWRMSEPTRLALNRRIGNAVGLRLPTYGFRLALVKD